MYYPIRIFYHLANSMTKYGDTPLTITTSTLPMFNNVTITLGYSYFGVVFKVFLAFDFCRLCVVVFFIWPQRSMTSDFEGFSIQDFVHYIYYPFLIPEKEFLVFSF